LSGIEFTLVIPPGNNDSQSLTVRSSFRFAESGLMPSAKLWRLLASSFTVSRIGADIAYFPAPVNASFSKIPAIVTIYDATVLKSPSQTSAKRAFERVIIWNAVRSASKIITLSQNSKNDLMYLYGVPGDRIAVVYLGYDKEIFQSQTIKELNPATKWKSQNPYIMHHGVIQPRKNLERLIEAYKLVLERDPSMDIDLVLVGPVGWCAEGVLKAAERVSGRGRVIVTGAVSEVRLAELIRGASLCVIPSLYEGFCLPMLECMACGTPTIAAETSCLPEISGGALAYFNPYSIDDMAAAMSKVLYDSALRKQLTEKALHRASEFSWSRTARETLDVIVAAYNQESVN